jgi:uncharacterized protein
MQPSLSSTSIINPLSQQDRILLIDSLRGIALLGILLINISVFGFPEIAWRTPTVVDEIDSVNFKVWQIIITVFNGTQRALFSLLFGCGVLVFTLRLEEKVGGILPAELFLRRQLWLLLFGLINAWIFLWPGDILYHYSILGAFIFAFRRAKPQYLIIAAIACLLFQTARENRNLYLQKDMIAKGEAVAAIDTAVVKLTEKQKDEFAAMNGFKNKQKVESKKKEFDKGVDAVHGTYGELYAYLGNTSVWFETEFIFYHLWDILLFMFLGMALFKMGIVQGEYSLKFYLLSAFVGLGVGIMLTSTLVNAFISLEFNSFEFNKNMTFFYMQIGRAFRSVGILGLILVLYKTGWFKGVFSIMQPVGQMAFTNYLMQSIICGIVFYGSGYYGIGLGLYGKLQRYELYYVVGAIWVFQIIFSNIWMQYFRFGPMEWLWRSLTYWKKQPFKKEVPEVVPVQV